MMAPQVRSEDRQKTIHLPLQSQKKKKKKITWAKLKTVETPNFFHEQRW
jgi:hypothetical protein